MAGEGGAGGPMEPLVSPTCGAGMFDDGDGGCDPCVDPPQLVQISCGDFYMPSLLLDGGPLYIYLYPTGVELREPLAGMVEVSYVSPDQIETYPIIFTTGNGWEIDVSPGPNDPAQIVVEPFSVPGACGDTYQTTEPVSWNRVDVATYQLFCPT
jgi:hypothetical protein